MPHGIVEEEYSSAEHIVLSVFWVDKRRKGARKRLECYGITKGSESALADRERMAASHGIPAARVLGTKSF